MYNLPKFFICSLLDFLFFLFSTVVAHGQVVSKDPIKWVMFLVDNDSGQ
jgi:hypothetical protein